MKITKLEQLKAPKGHQPHKSGTGVHADKRIKRSKTRADKVRKEINTYK